MNKIVVKSDLGLELGYVVTLEQLGTDETIYRAAKVCVGKGFDVPPADSTAVYKLLETLYTLRHMRLFEFAGLTIGVRCPIYVERQLRTYRKPDVERSLRYCEPIELSQSSTPSLLDTIGRSTQASLEVYKELRANGVSKEEARRVLPLDVQTEVYSFYTVRTLFHLFDERLAKSAQSETRLFVSSIRELFARSFPISSSIYSAHTTN